MATRKWSDLTTGQQRAVFAAGAAEAIVTIAALRDLARRPATTVRGPKVIWVLASFVQPVGPLAYFAAGRRST
ncbi:PLD nuclease N-terminal domain-containing protein [Aeromicrobium sp. CF3.5]|uniref:PLD nuclease N-terminal domain-containing protein n=1 Tax=Aeromicrobium sp. CF3.5 TaxID=3373078 RepID=UPI003EE466F5